ncbi:hypothetical protein [Salinispira pacifica]|nr:hypothetical protein [Salinispira pacifica]
MKTIYNKTLLCFGALLFLVLTPAFSIESENSEAHHTPIAEVYDEALGFSAGPMTGTGLTYHKTYGSKGWQIVAGALYSPEIQFYGNLLDYSLGFSHHWRVFSSQWKDILGGNLYIFTSIMHRGYIPWVDDSYYDEESETYVEVPPYSGSYTPQFTAGFGIGMELIGFSHFSIPIEVGYGLTWLPTAGSLQNQFAVELYPQISFRYRY